MRYVMKETDGGYYFGSADAGITILGITEATAERFLRMISENGVEDCHLAAVAEDFMSGLVFAGNACKREKDMI